MIIIDGQSFNVPILSLDETCDFLDKYAERTEDGTLRRELIGVYFNQQLKFGFIGVPTATMQALWEKLTEPVEFHTVVVPDEDGDSFTFTAYFAGVKRSLLKSTTPKTYWKSLTVNFIGKAPARKP